MFGGSEFMKKISICFIAVLVLSGCVAVEDKFALMYNPETKDTKECTYDPWGTFTHQIPAVINNCVKSYEAAGYQRVDK